ncbi:PLDc N-terminal domain-containing protein [Flavobacterium sp.]|uniref:GldL-related protein n=1 Tax=Flavobacterium sp. TaxID=239 RepID=UPI002631FB40|nr:PLDc N-terminal domain-containing protein [Flavobacterium sp.]
MKKDKIVSISFIISFVFSILGALLKIMHWGNSTLLLVIGIIALGVFIFASLYEIFQSNRIRSNEKFMWLVGFLTLGWFAGIVYLLLGRKRIV